MRQRTFVLLGLLHMLCVSLLLLRPAPLGAGGDESATKDGNSFPGFYLDKEESRADGKVFTSTVTSRERNAAPSWKEGQENPPLAARKAIDKATGLLGTLVKSVRKE
jgi:hypothetical protein